MDALRTLVIGASCGFLVACGGQVASGSGSAGDGGSGGTGGSSDGGSESLPYPGDEGGSGPNAVGGSSDGGSPHCGPGDHCASGGGTIAIPSPTGGAPSTPPGQGDGGTTTTTPSGPTAIYTSCAQAGTPCSQGEGCGEAGGTNDPCSSSCFCGSDGTWGCTNSCSGENPCPTPVPSGACKESPSLTCEYPPNDTAFPLGASCSCQTGYPGSNGAYSWICAI